ncbi:hypothetical protein A1F94_007949 [Pyrenophora tritici-repentis]|nr:hypothetical protein A1F94_007949 [Pyrenophora tritici-repentis]
MAKRRLPQTSARSKLNVSRATITNLINQAYDPSSIATNNLSEILLRLQAAKEIAESPAIGTNLPRSTAAKAFHSGAVWWSPCKLREARFRQLVKEKEKEKELLDKIELKEAKENNRIYQLKIKEAARAAREEAKKVRDEAKAAEAEIVAPTEGSRAGTVATTEAGEGGQDETNSALVENFDGIDWARLPDFIKPLARSKRPKSWIFQYGYRVVERHATSRIWFVCKYCHVHKTIDAGRGGLFNITQATTSAATHLSQPKPGHNLTKDGPKLAQRARGQLSLRQAFDAGLDVQQNTANAFGNFDVEGFRTATVMWLVNRNHPLSELTTPDFREMMRFANPEAEAALWVSVKRQGWGESSCRIRAIGKRSIYAVGGEKELGRKGTSG